MKNLNLKVIVLIITSIVFFTSCENEPLDPVLTAQINANNGSTGGSGGGTGGGTGGGVTPTTIVGTYILTAFNTSVPTDLNGDGTTSTNQMAETTCLNNSLFVLNSDNTFTSNSKGIDIDLTTTPNVLTCFTDPDTTGTWTLVGNILKTTYVEGGVTYNDEFTVVGNTLVYTVNNGEVVGTASGIPVYLTSDITIIYSKQ
jgi:hypothetical protein